MSTDGHYRAQTRARFVAVIGGSGAGKTTFVRALCRVLGKRACHVPLDDFYRDLSHLPPGRRKYLNFDSPTAIDWRTFEKVINRCRRGGLVARPHYDYATLRVATRRRRMRPIVIVDGLWLLRTPSMRRLFDLKIYLDAAVGTRCARRMQRDVAARGYTPTGVRYQLRTRVLPLHKRFVHPQRKWADLVLRQPYRMGPLLHLAAKLVDLTRTDPRRIPDSRLRRTALALLQLNSS